ncbi:DUF2182 domain-containing protein [Arhodomonas sp. AD133]|uniref:DUF2182 domain-containing protein n=1 Tax=Arhodomonas sp. AD133 TaxID=3415009 RepID=UPI003EB9647D
MVANAASAASRAVRRDRLVVLAALCLLTVLAWVYLWIDTGRIVHMSAAGDVMAPAAAVRVWDIGPLALTFVMWAVMMVGMMVPSAAPAILVYTTIVTRRRDSAPAHGAVWIFTGGYLAVWAAFSLGATLLQATLVYERLLRMPAMDSANLALTGVLLVVAGLYQWSPLKDVCLRKCRSPFRFFMFRWRSGLLGAFRMGAEHGLICVGCCWTLMLLLFTAGVMNLFWVAVIAGFVLLEKLAPGGRLLGRLAGVALGLIGVGIFVAGVWAY